jgi:sugar phosphate isomerase/epimerase
MDMTRTDFLRAVGGVAAAASVSSIAKAAPTPQSRIKRGVTMYSYQEEYYTRAMTLEECIREVSDMGADGIELMGWMYVPGYPKPSDHWVDQWHSWMDRYHTVPTAFSQIMETKLYKDRRLTDKEAVDMMVQDFKFARRLGYKIIRVMNATPLDLVEKCIPYAEENGIKMGCEIHSPTELNGPWTQRLMDIIHRTNTKNLGFVPDLSLFVQRPPRVMRQQAIRQGAVTDAIADYIEKAREDGVPETKAAAEAAKLGYKEVNTRFGGSYLTRVFGTMGARMENPRDLLKYMPFIFHIHAKFWEMTGDLNEYSIPYADIVPVLIEGGYDGYLSSEFEGQRYTQDAFETDSCEQIRRQHIMLRRLLGEV